MVIMLYIHFCLFLAKSRSGFVFQLSFHSAYILFASHFLINAEIHSRVHDRVHAGPSAYQYLPSVSFAR